MRVGWFRLGAGTKKARICGLSLVRQRRLNYFSFISL